MIFSLDALSFICGWGYVICWGMSLYPPILLNYHTKSVEGLSIDFAYLNFWGCISYLLSVSMMYFSTTVRLEYALIHAHDAHSIGAEAKQPLVRLNDVVYGVHSLLMVMVLLYQFYLAGYRRSVTQKLSKIVKIFSALGLLGGLLLMLHAYEISTTRRHYQLVDVANIFGTTKVVLSTVKYVPQAYFNYQRKSMKGFAVKGPVIDIVGGILCSSQLILDGYILNDLNGVYKHPTKLLLALVAILFGCIFIIQSKVYADEDDVSIYNKTKKQ